MAGDQPDWKRIDELFDACLDLDEDARRRLLDDHCGEEPALRRQVEALLSASPRGEALLGQRDAMLEGLLPDGPAGGPLLEPGTRLGDYTIVGLLGEGGMARVYLAEQHAADWQREVAIKVLSVGGAEMLARFHAERRILAGLEHPGIARLIDAGTTPAGLPYLVTERVEGEPIHRYCTRHALPLAARLDLFLQLADAVQHAHARLIVHRDIKPSNVLVDAEGRVRLLDFGIARLVESDDRDPLTRSGQLPMTPEYAAPEQLAGGAISIAIDIYQLGLMLFELATGLPPWKHWTSGSDLPSRLLPRASAAAQAATRPIQGLEARRLRGDLDAIIERATASRPGDRYATVQGLANDLRCHLRGERPGVRRESLPAALWRLARRNRVAAFASILLLAALVGWATTLQWHAARLERERETAQREALRAQHARSFLLDMFQRSDPLLQEQPGEQEVVAWRWLPQVEADARRALADTPGVQADLFETIAALYRRAGDAGAAERLLREALTLHDRLDPPDRGAMARLRAELASLLSGDGPNDEAGLLVAQALEDARALAPTDPRTAVAVLLDAASVAGARARSDEQAALMREALALLGGESSPEPVAEAEARLGLANALIAQGDAVAALAEASLALARASDALGPRHGRLVGILSSQATALGRLGRHDEAQAALRRALDIQQRWDHPDSTTVQALRNNLAIALGGAGRRDEEQRELRLLLEQRTRGKGEDHLEVGRTWQNLGASLAKSGDNAAAAAALAEALRIFALRLPEGHPQRAFPHISMALVHLQDGEPARAEQAALRAGSGLRDAVPEGHFAHAVVACLLAEARHLQSPTAESLAELRKQARRLASDPSAPADYLQRCEAAARRSDAT